MQRELTKRERLTLPRIAALACPADKQQVFLWDTTAPRLAVRATTGAKSFVFQSKLNGQTIRRTIGDIRTWNLEEARTEARRLQAQIDNGIDPRELDREKAEAKDRAKAAQLAAEQEAESRKRYTLQALCEAYCTLLESRGKTKSAAETRSVFKCHVIQAHPALAATPAREITSHQIAAIVRKVIEQGKDRTAGILRSYLLAAFNAAIKSPFDSKLPGALIAFDIAANPVGVIATIRATPGNRTLSAAELKDYMAGLGSSLPDQALRLALFAGGQRMAQLLRAKVSDYDPDAQILRLFDAKGRRASPREHLLPLAPEAAAIVADLVERTQTLNTPFLFSSSGRTELVQTTPGKRVTEICAGMKCERFDLRDIRRTCETMLAGMGISRDIRAQLLSHGLSGVQATHYDRHGYIEEKRAALVAWEQRLDDIATGKQSSNVLRMRRPAA